MENLEGEKTYLEQDSFKYNFPPDFWKFQIVEFILVLWLCPTHRMQIFNIPNWQLAHIVQGEALVRSSFWKESHACTMEKVSVP